jgi:hypothetical protein
LKTQPQPNNLQIENPTLTPTIYKLETPTPNELEIKPLICNLETPKSATTNYTTYLQHFDHVHTFGPTMEL